MAGAWRDHSVPVRRYVTEGLIPNVHCTMLCNVSVSCLSRDEDVDDAKVPVLQAELDRLMRCMSYGLALRNLTPKVQLEVFRCGSGDSLVWPPPLAACIVRSDAARVSVCSVMVMNAMLLIAVKVAWHHGRGSVDRATKVRRLEAQLLFIVRPSYEEHRATRARHAVCQGEPRHAALSALCQRHSEILQDLQ